jgi:parvulin-like peptidyl-prolyl isomerase
MMQFIRSNVGKAMVFLIIPAFILWMVLEIGMEVMGGAGSRPGALGSVNGSIITQQAYSNAYNLLLQQAQQQGGEITPEMERRISDQAWDQVIAEILLRQELSRRGIRVTDQEILWAARNLPQPDLARQEIFLTNGQFDLQKYREFLSTRASADIFGQLEQYYRESLPREKLARQLSAGRFVSDAELWRSFQDRTEMVAVDYVSLPLDKLSPTVPQVTAAEIRRYYDDNRDSFTRPQGARLKVAYLPLTITEADRQATLRQAQEIRQELADGADFAEVARRESDDPGSAQQGGDLGTFTRGQMVPAFDSAAFSLPVNEISQPVISQFGVHLLQVQERTGDQAKARHILLSFEKDPQEVDRLEKQLDAVAQNAARQGLRRASQGVPGLVFRDSLELTSETAFLPGVGPAQEALNWARQAQVDIAAGDGSNVSEVLESPQALYLVQMDEYYGAGQMTLAQATPRIRDRLVRDKRIQAAMGEANKILAEVRGGRSLEQVAQARGLAVQRSEPFSRVMGNPVFGQANAAIGVAFGTPVGQVGPVAETEAGLFLIRPYERTEADRAQFDAQKVQLRQQTTQMMQQELFMQWLRDARDNAKIKDNRERLLGQSA